MIYDFCVVGGGMVGSAAALALTKMGHQVAWVSGPSINSFDPADKPDVRMSAITNGSIELLDSIGAWQPILAMRTKPYDTLSVWEGELTPVSFYADEIGATSLGHFVENRLIQLGCEAVLQNATNLYRKADCAVTNIASDEQVSIELEDGSGIRSHWLIGADGGQSLVRQQTGIATSGWQYSQQAMGIIVELFNDSGAETWQQFEPSGPLAFLPMYDNYAALIWYDEPARLATLMQQTEQQLLDSIRTCFPID